MSVTNNPQRPRHHVGIDVSKERLDVCLMPDGEAFAVANDLWRPAQLLNSSRTTLVSG